MTVNPEWARLTAWGIVKQLPWSRVGAPIGARLTAWRDGCYFGGRVEWFSRAVRIDIHSAYPPGFAR